MKALNEIREFMEAMGIPGRDLGELPSSTKTFPDGAHWRIEISGVERPSTMEAMIDEARKRNVIIHRVIVTVGGSTTCTIEELKAILFKEQTHHDVGLATKYWETSV